MVQLGQHERDCATTSLLCLLCAILSQIADKMSATLRNLGILECFTRRTHSRSLSTNGNMREGGLAEVVFVLHHSHVEPLCMRISTVSVRSPFSQLLPLLRPIVYFFSQDRCASSDSNVVTHVPFMT